MQNKRRNPKVGRDDAAFDGLKHAARMIRAAVVDAAAFVRRLILAGHPLDEGSASIEELAERHGMFAAPYARMLARIGEALEICPRLADYITEGAASPEQIADFLTILRRPERLLRDDDHWEEWLRGDDTREFRERVRRRVAESRGEPVMKQIFLSQAGLEKLERVRTLLSRSKGSEASYGEAVEAAAECFLKHNDLLEKPAGKRRKGETEGDPSRHVPIDVQRELMAEHRDRCPVRFCGFWIWLENAHRDAHCEGGGREFLRMERPCGVHHLLWDRRLIDIRLRAKIRKILNRYGVNLNELRPAPASGKLSGKDHLAFRRRRPKPKRKKRRRRRIEDSS